MSVFVAMLRGVNVGAHNRIKMDELRAVFASLGLRDVQTFIQSGNVVFRSDSADERRLEDAIEKKFGFRAEVLLRTAAELRDAIARNPLAGREGADPAKLLITFLDGEAGAAPEWAGPEQVAASGREIYIYFPDGAGRSKLSWTDFAKKKKLRATARNLNTVEKLLAMAEKMEG